MSSPEKPESEKLVEPNQPNYVGVFAALAVLTAIEVGVSYLPEQRILILIPLALIKAGLVVLYFMHLKFDQRVFGAVFLMGVLMAFSIIITFSLLFAPLLGFSSK